MSTALWWIKATALGRLYRPSGAQSREEHPSNPSDGLCRPYNTLPGLQCRDEVYGDPADELWRASVLANPQSGQWAPIRPPDPLPSPRTEGRGDDRSRKAGKLGRRAEAHMSLICAPGMSVSR